MPFAFEKLHVYQKAIAFADAVCTLTRDLPASISSWPTNSTAPRCPLLPTLPKATADLPRPTDATFSPSLVGRCRNAFHYWR
jgi:hypothetical protein